MDESLLADVTPFQRDRLRSFAAMICSSPHNLVSRNARGELLTRHLPEGVALAHRLPSGSARLLDVGSGGGLPGVVIAIVRPDLEVHLLDSTAKKTSFLSETTTALGLAVQVHTGRAENLATTELQGGFDLVTARAVAPLDRLLPLTVPFLRRGGRLFAVKGDRWEQELAEAEDSLRRFGFAVLATPEEGSSCEAGTAGEETSDREPRGALPKVVVIERRS